MPGGARSDFADLGLRAEALAFARERDKPATDWLVELGIKRDLTGVAVLGRTCAAIEGREWTPKPDGQPVVTLPIWSGNSCIDILALCPVDGSRWWRRTDLAPVLGLDEIERAGFLDEPLHIRQNPLEWLRAGATGVVVLDWASAAFWLSGARRLIAHSRSTAHRVERALRHPGPKFEIKFCERSGR